jgi:hypothetical protein
MTSDSGEDEVTYRTDLVKLMIAHDTQEGRYSAANLAVERQTQLTGNLPPGSFLSDSCGGCHVLSWQLPSFSLFLWFSFFVLLFSFGSGEAAPGHQSAAHVLVQHRAQRTTKTRSGGHDGRRR